MKNSEFLYQLIQSMSKADKDNFMRWSRVRGKRSDLKYLSLYRAIAGQQHWNEEALKQSFDFSNFSEAKQHLMDLILRSMTIYDQHPESLMQSRLAEIRILLERSLYHFAMKRIHSAREVALREERLDALRALADMELIALPFVADVKSIQARRETVVAQRAEAFEKLTLVRDFKDLHDRDLNAVLDRSSKSGHFGPELVEALEAQPCLLLAEDDLPLRALTLKHRIQNVVKMQQLDFGGRAEVLSQTLGLFDRHPFLIDEEPVRYVFSLGGYGMCLNVIGRYEEALAATLKLLQVKTSKDNVQRSIFLNFATNVCTFSLLRGDVMAFREHLSYLLQGMRAHAGSTPAPTLAYVRYLFSIVFWMAGDLRRAYKFAKMVVEDPAGRSNLQAACKTFLLVLAWEMEDLEAVSGYLRAWRRQWKKKSPIFEIEQSFGEAMGSMLAAADERELKHVMERSLEQVNAYLSKGHSVRADNFIFLVHWLESKLQGRGLVETVRRKAEAG